VLSLAWPWMLIALPAPVLVRRFLTPRSDTSAALRAPLYNRLAATQERRSGGTGNRALLVLLWLLWLALIAAAARPQWVGDPVDIPVSGRDLLLAVDLSESMLIEDMQVDGEMLPRITVVKDVVGDFVARRSGDKLGLILFASQAYLQTPLTFDHETLATLLREARIGFAGRATAIGDAIGIAIKRLEDRHDSNRVLILLSDGADTASELPPRKAAELAAQYGIRIYTVGIGADTVMRRSFFGSRAFNPSADLDEDMLTDIAEQTGGRYFRARDPQELKAIYEELDKLEPVEQEAEILRPIKDLFYWPLALAFGAFLALAGLVARRGSDV